ncbi:SEC-C metal-binding domain-containing protein [Aeromonas salmonicida]
MGQPAQLPNVLPCQCLACGYSFIARNPIGGGGFNIKVSNISTKCPRCGGIAKYPDWHTDESGTFHFDEIFSQLYKVRDTQKLRVVKENLEAANEDFSAEELAEALVELDPSFNHFSEAIKKLPASAIVTLVSMLFSFITLIIAYQQLLVSNEDLSSNNKFQQQQLDLAREQFEYQKEKDKQEKLKNKNSAESLEIEILKTKLDFEQRLRQLEQSSTPIIKTPRSTIKGNQRNKPCLCGSGKKAKKCHQYYCE